MSASYFNSFNSFHIFHAVVANSRSSLTFLSLKQHAKNQIKIITNPCQLIAHIKIILAN